MKKRSPDRRIARTRKLLSEALISLLFEKEYDGITVQEILDKADVGRSTFYLHFADKDELLSSGLVTLRDEVMKAHQAGRTGAEKPPERLIGFSLFLFKHINDHRRIYHALGRHGGEIVRSGIQQMVTDIIRGQAATAFKRKPSSDIPAEVLVYFLASSFLSLMEWWIEQKNPPSPETINGIYRALILPSLSANL